MTVIEKVELTTITAFMVFFILLRHRLPTPSSHATLILSLSSLLLLQGLIRDLIYLVQLNKSTANAQTRMVFGLCVESFVGIVGVMTGAFWMFAFAYTALQISFFLWGLLVLSVLIAGFLTKDYVIDLSALKIYKDVDHANVIVSRKKA